MSGINSNIRLVSALAAVFCFCAACQRPSAWNETEFAIIQSLSIASLRSAPLVESNRVANSDLAAEFGRQLFNDPGLSDSGKISCASCHQPELFFTDGLKKGKGEAELTRNTPTLAGLAWHTWFYWDGRKDSLWSQALAPLEAGKEMNSSRLKITRHIGQNQAYRKSYEALFGAYPVNLLRATQSVHASPYGDSERQDNWYRIPPAYRETVNQVFSNTGKVLGAYLRTLNYGASSFDQYAALLAAGNNQAANRVLGAQARAGLALFISDEKTQCLRCHNGPLFTNFEFHNIGSGNLEGENLDFGRLLGVQAVLMDEFNCQGKFSDAPPDGCTHLKFLNRQIDESMQGAYKTPSLRNIAATAPYFHDGRYASLAEVLQHYNDAANTAGENPLSELNPIDLDSEERAALEAFLRSLASG